MHVAGQSSSTARSRTSPDPDPDGEDFPVQRPHIAPLRLKNRGDMCTYSRTVYECGHETWGRRLKSCTIGEDHAKGVLRHDCVLRTPHGLHTKRLARQCDKCVRLDQKLSLVRDRLRSCRAEFDQRWPTAKPATKAVAKAPAVPFWRDDKDYVGWIYSDNGVIRPCLAWLSPEEHDEDDGRDIMSAWSASTDAHGAGDCDSGLGDSIGSAGTSPTRETWTTSSGGSAPPPLPPATRHGGGHGSDGQLTLEVAMERGSPMEKGARDVRRYGVRRPISKTHRRNGQSSGDSTSSKLPKRALGHI